MNMPMTEAKVVPLFLSFKKRRPQYPRLRLPTHWICLRFLAKCFLPLISTSHSRGGGGSPKESKYSYVPPVPRQQHTQWVPKLMMHGERQRSFGSFLLKTPLIGMRRRSHHFLRSMFERGVSSNLSFFQPKCRRKVGPAIELGGRTCSSFPSTVLTRLIVNGTPIDANMPRRPPYCADPPLTTPSPTRNRSVSFFRSGVIFWTSP